MHEATFFFVFFFMSSLLLMTSRRPSIPSDESMLPLHCSHLSGRVALGAHNTPLSQKGQDCTVPEHQDAVADVCWWMGNVDRDSVSNTAETTRERIHKATLHLRLRVLDLPDRRLRLSLSTKLATHFCP
jgi:hypothetical protein